MHGRYALISLAFYGMALGCSCGSSTPAAPAAPAPGPTPVPAWIWTGVEFPQNAAFVGEDTIVVNVDGAATAIDAATGRARAFLESDGEWSRDVTPSRDGHAAWLGAGEWSMLDGASHLVSWDVMDGLGAHEEVSSRLRSFVLLGAQRFVVVGRTRSILGGAAGDLVAGHMPPGGLYEVAIDPTARTISLLDAEGLQIRDVADGATRAHVAIEGVSLFAYSDDGTRLVVGTAAGPRVIDVATGRIVQQAEIEGLPIGISRDGAWMVVATAERWSLVDGHTLAVVGEMPAAEMTRMPFLVSRSGSFVPNPTGVTPTLYDLRSGVTRVLPFARVVALSDDASRVLVRTDDAMQMLDTSSPDAPLWSVPLSQPGYIRSLQVLDDVIVASSAVGTWVVRPGQSPHRWHCLHGYPRRQEGGAIWLSCDDGSVIDAATGEERSPATGSVTDPCVYDSFAEMMGTARACDDDDQAALRNERAGLEVRAGWVGHIVRTATGQSISLGLYSTDELQIAMWDERGRASDPGGELLVRDPGPLRTATLHAPERADVVSDFFAHAH